MRREHAQPARAAPEGTFAKLQGACGLCPRAFAAKRRTQLRVWPIGPDPTWLWGPESRDQLLLVVAGVLAGGVVRLDRGGVREAAARVDAEVVAEERAVRADA